MPHILTYPATCNLRNTDIDIYVDELGLLVMLKLDMCLITLQVKNISKNIALGDSHRTFFTCVIVSLILLYCTLSRSLSSKKNKVVVYVHVLHNYVIILTDQSEPGRFICRKRGFSKRLLSTPVFPVNILNMVHDSSCVIEKKVIRLTQGVKMFNSVVDPGRHNRRLRNMTIKCIR